MAAPLQLTPVSSRHCVTTSVVTIPPDQQQGRVVIQAALCEWPSADVIGKQGSGASGAALDRGYIDFERLLVLTLSAAFFVVRTKSNVLLKLLDDNL